MKDYVANQKIHKSIPSQNLSPKVTMITGDEQAHAAFNKRESQISQISKAPISNTPSKPY